MEDLNGKVIGRYQIFEPLGEGGMAKVYRGFDTRLECDVAIKFISRDKINPTQWEKMRIRFDQEAKRMAKLNHPHIVRVIDYGEYNGVPFFVMPFLAGGSLKDMAKALKGKGMDYRQACILLIPIAQALDYAHHNDIVHRDVKPANILLTEAGQSMLTDFGVAKILNAEGGFTLTGTGGVGTPKYMAPEQWKNQITPSVDVYSLGVVLYELVTGHLPYQGDTPAAVLAKQISEPLPSPRQFNPDLPLAVELIINKALDKEPSRRFSSMMLFAEEMEKVCKKQAINLNHNNIPQDKMNAPSFHVSKQQDAIKKSKDGNTSKKILLSIIGAILLGIILIGGVCSVFTIFPYSPSSTAQPPSLTLNISPVAKNEENNLITPQIIVENGQSGIDKNAVISSINPKDGAMMLYIPGGEFLMGSVDSDIQALDSEKPQHAIYLNAFWIYKTEVSNKLYKKCIASGVCSLPIKTEKYDSDVYGDYPIEYVNWEQAKIYCEWAGGRLPTEAEWEKAARGTDGRKYPWGNKNPTPDEANYRESKKGGTTPVGIYPKGASPYGVLDMSGNVQEWVQDWYSGDYYRISPKNNPKGPESGNARVLRGGSWRFAAPVIRTAMRLYLMPASSEYDYREVGFRCAKNE